VKPGDVIVAVNGVRDGGRLSELQTSKTLNLAIKPGSQQPLPEKGEFAIELDKPEGASLGAKLEDFTTFEICEIAEGGLLDDWNKKCGKPRQVVAGDFIVEVNGQTDECRLAELQRSKLLRLVISDKLRAAVDAPVAEAVDWSALPFKAGQCVDVFGLTSAAGKALNGQKGLVTSYSRESGRFEVRLGDALKSLKQDHLRKVEFSFAADAERGRSRSRSRCRA